MVDLINRQEVIDLLSDYKDQLFAVSGHCVPDQVSESPLVIIHGLGKSVEDMPVKILGRTLNHRFRPRRRLSCSQTRSPPKHDNPGGGDPPGCCVRWYPYPAAVR